MNKRDLLADLKFCDRATPGPWRHEWNPDYSEIYAPGFDNPTPIILVGHDPHDADFIVQAREGWPHAIERAIQAESLMRKLVGVIDDLCRQINQCGLAEQMWEVYRKTKEALGDD